MNKLYLLILSLLLTSATGLAQIPLITPADGGFENATTTFFANGWNSVNDVTNTWIVDAIAAPFAGANSAYITNDGGVTNAYSYTTSAIQVSHFYRDVPIPAAATSITLSFYYKSDGETGADRLSVYTAPTSLTLAGGTLPGGTSTQVFLQTGTQASYAQQIISLPIALAGTTVRLIFTWQNDGNSIGNDPPASIDDVSLSYCIAPTVVTQPAITQTICEGATANFIVSATGTSLTYQWRKGTTDLSDGGNISGATSNTLTINPVAIGDAAANYNVVVSSACAPSTTSDDAKLIVTPTVGTPTAITISAGTEPACQLPNATTTTTYATTATNSTGFNWSVSNPAAGVINPTTGVMTWANGFSGTVDIQVTANGCNGPSAQVTRTVNVTPTVGTPTAITISAGTEPACQLPNATTTTTYATTATNSTGFNWSVSNPAAGVINPTTGVMTWANGFSGTVDIQVTANGCNGPSAQVTRTVNITPTVGTPTAITISAGTEPACQLPNGTTTTTYATTATNSTGFNWSVSNPAAGVINATTGVMTWANGFSGSVDIQVTANGCNGPSAQVTRTVNITPTVGTPTAITISAGTEPACQLPNGTTTTTYATTATNSTGFNWSVSNPAAGVINATTGVMTWANGFSGTVDIQVTANGCNGPSAQVTRTVNITPTVGTPTAITISAGTEPACQLPNGTTTTTYATTATNSTGFNWSVSNPAAGVINATTGVMTWANGFSGSVNIQVRALGCNGPSAQVIRPVNITPTVGTPTAITISAGAQPICQLTNGTTTTTYATTASNNTGFNWSLSNPAAGVINPSTGVMTWANGFSGSVNIQVTASGCNGPSSQTIRLVNITPTVGTPTAITVSAGTEPTCQLTIAGTTTTYSTTATNSTGFTWSRSNPAAGNINAGTGVMTWTNGFSGSVNIVVVANGCNGPSAQTIRTVNITPTVGTPTAITVAGGTEPTCQLTNATTTTNYSTTASNSTGFAWSLSNPAAGTINAATGVMTWANGFFGTVTIRVRAIGCNGPSAQITRGPINVTQTVGTPTAITIFAGTQPTCQLTNGTTTTDYNTTATNSTGFNWSLSNPAAGVINATSGLMTWANGFFGSVDIQVTANGCNGPSAMRIRSVVVNPLPSLFTVTGGGSYCNGSGGLPVGLSGSEVGVNYQLKRGATNVGAPLPGTGSALNFGNQTVAGTYTVVATTAAGCSITMTGSVDIVVHAPVANAGPDWSLCVGSVTIGGSPAAAPASGAPYTYSWTSAPAGFTSTLSNPTVSPAVATTYSLIVTDVFGCSSAANTAVVSIGGASTKTWIGSGTSGGGPDNNFNNALNWTPAGVPDVCNDVIITTNSGPLGSTTIILTADATINSLALRKIAH